MAPPVNLSRGESLIVAGVILGVYGFAMWRIVNKRPDYDALLDAAERRELTRAAAREQAPPDA